MHSISIPLCVRSTAVVPLELVWLAAETSVVVSTQCEQLFEVRLAVDLSGQSGKPTEAHCLLADLTLEARLVIHTAVRL